MKASELRIGSFLIEKELGQCVVYGVSNDIIQFTELRGEDVYYSELDCFEPIRLTEQWLLDFGFEWNKETKSFEHKDFYLWHVSKSINVDIQNWQVFNYVLKAVANRNIKYVHQLQNLYFSLTGEELTIKEKVK